MGKGRDLGFGKGVELIADHLEDVVQTRCLKDRTALGLSQ